MKNYFLRAVLFSFMVMVAAGCFRNDSGVGSGSDRFYEDFDSGDGDGTVTFQGNSSSLRQGIIDYEGQQGNLFSYRVTLFSRDLELDLGTGDITGTGEIVALELRSDERRLKSGKYVIPDGSDDPLLLVGMRFADDTSEWQFDTEISLKSGSVVVQDQAELVYIDFDVKLTNGQRIVGSYLGNPQRRG